MITCFVAGNLRNSARNRRVVFCEAVEDAAMIYETPESTYAYAERGEELCRRIHTLRSKLRIVVEMHVLHGLPMADVATSLALRLKTTRARLTLARDELLRLKFARHFHNP